MMDQPQPLIGPSPSDQLDVLPVVCAAGELESEPDSYHVLDFHVGKPVQVTTRLDSRARAGLQYEGEFCVLPAGLTGQWAMRASWDALVIRLSPLLVEEAADSLRLKPSSARIDPALRIRDPHLEYIGGCLQAERAAGYPNGRLYMDSLATAIAVRLLRRQARHAPAVFTSKRQLPKWRLRSVCDYIEANLDRSLSLAELARVAGFSVSHFKPLFRRAVGLPVHRYVIERRVERARQLILQGDRTGDIALTVGFTHQSHMARWLRRVLGIGPADIAGLSRD
jgi:AraC family transcriptional regulator